MVGNKSQALRSARTQSEILRRRFLAGAVAVTLLATFPAGTATSSPTEADSAEPRPVKMRFVPDVVGQFRAMSERGEALGWYIDGGPDPTMCKHWQGIARSTHLGTPYFFVTRSGNQAKCLTDDDDPGNLVIIRMKSRDTNGERLRSNRLVHEIDTDDSLPAPGDRVVEVISFDGSAAPKADFWPRYHHPGGVQLIDDVLAVALEEPAAEGLPKNLIMFLDVSDPENPTILSRFDPGERADWSAGLVAVTPLPDGRYLMLITGKSNRALRIYTSDGTDLRSESLSWELFDDVSERELEDELGLDWPSGGAHQMLNFVREGGINGDLYLFGARNSSSGGPGGDDHIDLYRVVGLSESRFRLHRVATRHLRAVGTPTHVEAGCCDIANFAAASGVYVSPSGELLFYATEHDNDGPGGSVKAGEWRHKHMVRPGSSTYDPTANAGGPYVTGEGGAVQLDGSAELPITRAWLELFADDDFTERSVVIDYPDFAKDDFDDFRDLDGDPGDTDNFSDDASSMRWFAPKGCWIRVNDDHYGDSDFPGEDTRTLLGEGRVVELPDLDEVRNDRDSDEIDGAITSVTFCHLDCSVGSDTSGSCLNYYSAPLSLRWDLDGDGSFDAVGRSPNFSAAQIDGPATVQVELRATHPTDGRSGTATATVSVDNVAPTFEAVGAFDPTGAEIGVDVAVALVGVPVTLRASFTDPGVADIQTATIDWGDGAVRDSAGFDTFSDASGGMIGEMSHSHSFAVSGRYEIVVEVVDDDEGHAQTAVGVDILAVEDALQLVVDELDGRMAATSDPQVRKALMRARDDLAGSNMGLGANGALDELERGNPQAAVVKITHAVAALEDAEAAGARDLWVLKDLLVLAARSIAQGSYGEARAVAAPGNADHQRQLDEIARLMEQGAALHAAEDHLGAIQALADAVRRAAAMCRCRRD